MLKKSISIFIIVIIFCQAGFGSSEYYLQKLATGNKISRIIGCSLGAVGGCYLYSYGKGLKEGTISPDDPFAKSLFNVTGDQMELAGTVLVPTSILLILLPGKAEMELNKARKIDDCIIRSNVI